jgi:phage-related protein
VLHAFEKKMRRSPKPDIDLARARLRALVNERKKK